MKRVAAFSVTMLALLSTGLLGVRAGVAQEAEKGSVELYDGTVEVEIFPPGSDHRTRFDWGEATASFALQGDGRMAVVVNASIEDENDAGFHLVLEPSGDGGWQGATEEWTFAISPEGKISGNTQSIGQQISIAGNRTPDEIELDLVLTITDDASKRGCRRDRGLFSNTPCIGKGHRTTAWPTAPASGGGCRRRPICGAARWTCYRCPTASRRNRGGLLR